MSDKAINRRVISQLRDDDDAKTRRQRMAATDRFFRSRLRLSHLRLLVAIDELGQLKKVADRLGVTPPAVSKQVRELEDAIELQILTRVGNNLEFTEAGKLLTRHARQVMMQIDRTRIDVEKLCAGANGAIGLGAVPTVAPFLLPALVAHLRDNAPGTSIRIAEGLFDVLGPMLQNSTLDVVLVREAGHSLPDNLAAQTVLSDPLTLVCGADHPLARQKRLQWKHLAGVPWLLPLRGSSTYLHLEHLLSMHGLSLPEGSIHSVSLSVNVSLLQVLPFVALLPLAYVQRYLNSKLVRVLPLSTGGFQSDIRVLWRKDNDGPLVKLLLDAILDRSIRL
jgi:DNA-binding transcriptional LysR family regulator